MCQPRPLGLHRGHSSAWQTRDCLGCLCSTGSHELGSHFGACYKAKGKQVLKPKRLEEAPARPSHCESLGQRQRQRSHHRVLSRAVLQMPANAGAQGHCNKWQAQLLLLPPPTSHLASDKGPPARIRREEQQCSVPSVLPVTCLLYFQVFWLQVTKKCHFWWFFPSSLLWSFRGFSSLPHVLLEIITWYFLRKSGFSSTQHGLQFV